jgi:hypothetical protein
MMVLLMGDSCEVRLEMDLSAIISIPSFLRFGSAVQKLLGGGGYTYTHTSSMVTSQAAVIFCKIRKIR